MESISRSLQSTNCQNCTAEEIGALVAKQPLDINVVQWVLGIEGITLNKDLEEIKVPLDLIYMQGALERIQAVVSVFGLVYHRFPIL